jgi:hypothetical protein
MTRGCTLLSGIADTMVQVGCKVIAKKNAVECLIYIEVNPIPHQRNFIQR